MKLFNHIIEGIEGKLGGGAPRRYPYDPAAAWPETEEFELVMLRDAAYELGGEGKPGISLTCVTTDPALVDGDEILVYGRDLGELSAASPYARIALLRVGDIESDEPEDTEGTFRAIQNIDFVRYHVFPKGFMLRTSSESNREQVRVSRDAVKKGIGFRQIGDAFIRQYKKDPNVLSAKLIFVTDPAADYKGLADDAKSARDITMTLSKILEGLPTDCSSCALKPVCDEVEGMKELHFGKNAQEGR